MGRIRAVPTSRQDSTRSPFRVAVGLWRVARGIGARSPVPKPRMRESSAPRSSAAASESTARAVAGESTFYVVHPSQGIAWTVPGDGGAGPFLLIHAPPRYGDEPVTKA